MSTSAAVQDEQTTPAWDLPEAVWDALMEKGVPLSWPASQKAIAQICRVKGVPYGVDHKERRLKHMRLMSEYYGPNWYSEAMAEERSVRLGRQDEEAGAP